MKRNLLIAALSAGFLVTAAAQTAGSVLEGKSVALVLAGGSAYGLAHIGVIKVLEEIGIPVDIVVGTSMGSIIGGFYATGYDARELEKIVTETDWIDLMTEDSVSENESFLYMKDRSRYAASLRFDKKGFAINSGYLSGHKMLRYVDAVTLGVPFDMDFDTLPRRYRAVAADISNGERVIISRGSLADAMRASSSLPGVFSPYLLNGAYLVDGCIVDNLPIDVARAMGADIIIAVDLIDATPFDATADNRSPISTLNRAFDILVHANVKTQLPRADILISIDMTGYLASDFEKSQEIINLGEKTARLQYGELSAIAVRETHRIKIARSPPIAKIMVEGTAGKRGEQIRKLFDPLVGKEPDRAEIQRIFTQIDSSGNKGTIRISREYDKPDSPLIVTITKKKDIGNILRLNFSYDASFSTALISDLDLVPALSFPNLTTLGSYLLIDAELFDEPGFDIRFIQPMGKFAYISPYHSYIRDYSTIIAKGATVYQYSTVAQTTGLRVVIQPAYGAVASVGLSHDWTNDLSLVHAGFEIQRVDSHIFPMHGLLLSGNGLMSLPSIGSSPPFGTIDTRGSAFLSLDTPLSLALLWKAGTVVTSGEYGNTVIPPFYKPDLSGRRMFPGPLSSEERIGNHVAGYGMECKYNLNHYAKGIPLPVFALFHIASGVVLDELSEASVYAAKSHWNATLGVGAKISGAFGFSFRGGLLQRTDKTLVPFIALDIGSIAYK